MFHYPRQMYPYPTYSGLSAKHYILQTLSAKIRSVFTPDKDFNYYRPLYFHPSIQHSLQSIPLRLTLSVYMFYRFCLIGLGVHQLKDTCLSTVGQLSFN